MPTGMKVKANMMVAAIMPRSAAPVSYKQKYVAIN